LLRMVPLLAALLARPTQPAASQHSLSYDIELYDSYVSYGLDGQPGNISTFQVISLGKGYGETRRRLVEAGCPPGRVHMWQGVNGKKQQEEQDPSIRQRARDLGVLQPDEGCESPPPKPSPSPPPSPPPPSEGKTAQKSSKGKTKKSSKGKTAQKSSKGKTGAVDEMLYNHTASLYNHTASLHNHTELDSTVCNELASYGWHQFGISVAHVSAWSFAAGEPKWTVILEEDAGQSKPTHGKSWYTLANYMIAQAPADAEFIWLSGQDGAKTGPSKNRLKADGPLFVEGSTFCPHTYAISPAGAQKLKAAAERIGVYGAVDIFLKIELEKILKTYMVNDKRAVHDGLMKPNPSEYAPRNSGIGWQIWS